MNISRPGACNVYWSLCLLRPNVRPHWGKKSRMIFLAVGVSAVGVSGDEVHTQLPI